MLKLVTVLKRFSKNMHIGLIFLHISVKSDIFAKKAAIKFETSLYEIGWALTDSETGCCCCCCSCCCDAIALITHALQFHTHTQRGTPALMHASRRQLLSPLSAAAMTSCGDVITAHLLVLLTVDVCLVGKLLRFA